MKIRKLKTGNYLGYLKGYYFFIYRRPHGKWCARIGKNGEWLNQEGYHGTFLRTVKKAMTWSRNKINLDIELLNAQNGNKRCQFGL